MDGTTDSAVNRIPLAGWTTTNCILLLVFIYPELLMTFTGSKIFPGMTPAGTAYPKRHKVAPLIFVILTVEVPPMVERFKDTFVMNPIVSVALRLKTTFLVKLLLMSEGVALIFVTTIPV